MTGEIEEDAGASRGCYRLRGSAKRRREPAERVYKRYIRSEILHVDGDIEGGTTPHHRPDIGSFNANFSFFAMSN